MQTELSRNNANSAQRCTDYGLKKFMETHWELSFLQKKKKKISSLKNASDESRRKFIVESESDNHKFMRGSFLKKNEDDSETATRWAPDEFNWASRRELGNYYR